MTPQAKPLSSAMAFQMGTSSILVASVPNSHLQDISPNSIFFFSWNNLQSSTKIHVLISFFFLSSDSTYFFLFLDCSSNICDIALRVLKVFILILFRSEGKCFQHFLFQQDIDQGFCHTSLVSFLRIFFLCLAFWRDSIMKQCEILSLHLLR